VKKKGDSNGLKNMAKFNVFKDAVKEEVDDMVAEKC